MSPRSLFAFPTLLLVCACTPSSGDDPDPGDNDDATDEDSGDDDDVGDAEPNEVWSLALGEPVSHPLVPYDENLVTAVSDQGTVFFIRGNTGAIKWQDETQIDVTFSHAETDNGYLLLPNRIGYRVFHNQTESTESAGLTDITTREGYGLASTGAGVVYTYLNPDYTYASVCENGCEGSFEDRSAFTAPAIEIQGDVVGPRGSELVRMATSAEALQGVETVVVWSASVGFDVSHTPIEADDYVVLSSDDGDVACLDADSGDAVWSFEGGTRMSGPVSIDLDDGSVVFAGNDGIVRSLSLRGGVERWSYQLRDAVIGGVTIHDGVVYAASYDGTLVALDVVSGEVLWDHDLESNVESRPTVQAGKVVVADEEGLVRAFAPPSE